MRQYLSKSLKHSLVWVLVMVLLAACNQQQPVAELEPTIAVPVPGIEISKEMTVHHSTSFAPRVTKTTPLESVDATSGQVTLDYTLTVENILVAESRTATVEVLRVKNTGGSSVTVNIVDKLYCDNGAGGSGTFVANVYDASNVVIAAGAAYEAGPFPGVDVLSCPNGKVVNVVTVSGAASGSLTVNETSGPPAYKQTAISSIFAAKLVDDETIPSGWTVTAATLTEGGMSVPFTANLVGNVYTIVANEVAPAGTYQLSKTLTRNAGVPCTEQQVVNEAYMEGDANIKSSTTIILYCQVVGDQWCSPGYWRNNLDTWGPTGYSPSQTYQSAFGVPLSGYITLKDAINGTGGGNGKKARESTAALLSTAHPNVNYSLTVAQVIAKVQAGDWNFPEFNNCPW